MNWQEQVVDLACAGEALVGILTRPEAPCTGGVVIVVGGPQYRVGSHRQFVLLARHLAATGFAVLRFDVRGMGDSGGAMRDFEQIDADIGCAVDALMAAVPRLTRVALWGLCDGASAALLYIDRTHDARVQALCLVNPWLRSQATLARTHVKHYYLRRLLERGFWNKLFSGQVGVAALQGLIGNLRKALRPTRAAAAVGGAAPAPAAPYPQRMAASWFAFTRPLLLLLSGDDYTAREFLEYLGADRSWRGALARTGLTRHDIAGADHTLSSPQARQDAEAATAAWLRQAFAAPEANGASMAAKALP